MPTVVDIFAKKDDKAAKNTKEPQPNKDKPRPKLPEEGKHKSSKLQAKAEKIERKK